MKFKRLIISTSFLIILGLFITNFTYAQTLRSVKPLFTEEEALILPKAEGYWKLSENEQMIIEKSGDNLYRIEFIEANYSSIHEGVFTKLGSEYYLHISPFYKDGTILSQINSLPLYVIFQIEINDSVFLLHDFSEGFIKNKLLPSFYIIDDNGMVVFSEFEKLKEILTKSINDKTIFRATTTLERVRNVAVQSDTLPINTAAIQSNRIFKKLNLKPEFPYSDGWLGGDGALSVQLSDNKVMWIFSDSYVSDNPNASKRKESSDMVANTIAITAFDNNQVNTHYFWRKSSGKHYPFFESHTDRYKFWPVWAFYRNDTVFVFMQKVGAKETPDANDLFNFRIMGTSLAVITNVDATDPFQWNIKLFPYSEIYPDETWTQAGTDENCHKTYFKQRIGNAQYFDSI